MKEYLIGVDGHFVEIFVVDLIDMEEIVYEFIASIQSCLR